MKIGGKQKGIEPIYKKKTVFFLFVTLLRSSIATKQKKKKENRLANRVEKVMRCFVFASLYMYYIDLEPV